MLQHRFIKAARAHPDKIAFIDKSSKRDMRYDEVLVAVLLRPCAAAAPAAPLTNYRRLRFCGMFRSSL